MCGLFGYINIRQKTKVQKNIFHTLGMINDSRGGDSVGYFIDNYIYKGIDKEATAYSQLYNEELDSALSKPVNVALGHCRKTSVGSTTIAAAQPVVVTNEQGDVELVMIHNGTLINYKELASKYLGKIPDYFTDSYIIAHIVNKHGFDVLGEYQGAGAFVFVDYKTGEPVVYVFKGSSICKSTDKMDTEERPLFYHYNSKTGGLYFSSIFKILETTTMELPDEVLSFNSNTLYKITKKGAKVVKYYDRTKIISYKATPAAATYPYGSYNYNYDFYSGYDTPRKNNSTNSSFYPNSTYDNAVSLGIEYLDEFLEGDVDAISELELITSYEEAEDISAYATDNLGRLYELASNYYAHGICNITKDNMTARVYCIEGFMFKSEIGVKAALLLKTLSGETDFSVFMDKYYLYINRYLINPITTLTEDGNLIVEHLTKDYDMALREYKYVIKPKVSFQLAKIRDGKFSKSSYSHSTFTNKTSEIPLNTSLYALNSSPNSDKSEVMDIIGLSDFLCSTIKD